jgi:hypothetical protein
MRLTTKLLKISTDMTWVYETSNWIYNITCLTVSVDLFFFDFTFSLSYWFTRESVAEKMARFNAFLHEYFVEEQVAEPKPKRKYVKKEVVKRGPGRPKKK